MMMKTPIILGISGLLAVFGRAGHAEEIAVTDAVARVVGFPQCPQRIVVAGKASFMLVDAVYLFPEARQRVVAHSGGKSWRPGAGDFLAHVVRGSPAPVALPGNAGVEPIVALSPDVVLLKSSSVRLGEDLERVGIRVVYLDFETPEQYERDLATLGRLLGAEARSRQLDIYFAEIADRVGQRTSSLAPARKPRVLLLQYSKRGGVTAFSVPPAVWIQTKLVERAGGIPVWTNACAGGGWTVVNLEQVAAWDPDVVFVVNYAEPAEEAVAAMQADGKWQSLRAAKGRRVFAFPGDFGSWDQPDTRWGLGMLWAATRLHPSLFRDVDIVSEAIRFYALYGMDEKTVRSEVLPLIHENIAPVSDEN